MIKKLKWNSTSSIAKALFLVLFIATPGALVVALESAPPLTVQEVTRDLACPCQCPLILQDCNMSCGLRWKEEVGQKIAEGMSKQEIIEYFIATHGESARLTSLQKVEGKIYQYTRGFGTLDWVILYVGVFIWLLLMFFGVYFLVKKLLHRQRALG